MRIILTSILLILLLVLFSVAGLHLFLMTERGERFALDTVNSLIPGKISYGRASISLLGQHIELGDALLLGPDDSVILTTETIRAEMNLPALLRKRIIISSASAFRPKLMLKLSEDNRLNIVQAFVEEEETPEEPGSEYSVILESIAIKDGNIGFEAKSRELLISLSDVDITSSMDFMETSGRLRAAIENARIAMGGSPIALHNTIMQASLHDARLDPLFLETNTGNFHAALKGSVQDLFNNPVLDITLDSGGEISDFAAVFGAEKAFTGNATGRIALKGTLDNPDSSGEARYSGGKIAGVRIDRGRAAFALNDRVFTLHEASAHIASGDALVKGTIDLKNAFSKGFLLSRPDPGAVSYDLAATARGLDFTRIFPDGKGYPKSVSGNAVVSGKGITPPGISGKTTYALSLKDGFPDSPVKMDNVTVKGRAVLDYPMLSLTATSITTPGMDTNIQGKVNLAARTLQAGVNLKADRMERAFARPLDRISGSLAAAAQISGSFGSPRVLASAKGRNVRWQEYSLGDIAMEAGLDERGQVRIAELEVNNGEPVLTASGSVKVFQKGFTLDPRMPLSANAHIRSSNLRKLIAQGGVKGSIEGDLHIGGSALDPSGTFAVEAAGIGYHDLELGNISLEGGISGGTATIERLDLSNRESVMHASGRIHILDTKKRRIMPDPEVNLIASGSGIRIEDFGFPAQGILSLHANISGSMKNPQGTFLANATDLAIQDQNIEKAGIYSVIGNRKVSIESLDIAVKGDQRITGSGWISLDEKKQYDFALSSSGIMLDSFPFLKAYQVTKGRAAFTISGQGTLGDPHMSGSLRLMDIAVSNQNLKDVSIDLLMKDWKLNMTGQNSFGFRGTYDVKTSDLLIQAFFDHMELVPYFAIAGRPDLGGLLTGTAEIRGNAHDIEDIEMTLDVADVDISLKGTNLISASKLALWYHDRQLNIPLSRISLLSRGSMTIQAVTDRNGRLDMTAQGTIPMGVMAVVDQDLADLEGDVRFRLSAQGPVMKPVINGDVYLSNVQYILSYNNQSLHNVNGHISLTPEQVVIENLAGQLDTGYFTARGTIGLRDFQPVEVNLNASARSLPVIIPDSMELLIETNVSLSGTPDDTLLQGNVAILDGLYYKDLQLNLIAEVGERITGGRRAAEAPGEPIHAPFLRNLSLDLTVIRRGTVMIENNLAEMSLNPDLQIVGTLNNPVATGRVSVAEGTITYQKRTFTVTRGVVDFSNPYRTEPEVDLRAEGRVREWTIFLAVSGPLDNLNIELSSNPPAENAVILSLLATGRTPDEIAGGTGTVQRSPSSMLAEVLANTYGERVRESTGLDILEFETKGPLQGRQGEDIKITVGEELTRRLTVKYSLETQNNEVTRTAIAEFKFFENLAVNGFQDSKGAFGADLQFKAEFR